MLSACACMRLVVARGSDLVHERGEPSKNDVPDPGRGQSFLLFVFADPFDFSSPSTLLPASLFWVIVQFCRVGMKMVPLCFYS